ncbi:cationic peroxidase 1 [Aegilops tauschii subsp. strangulata]|uniref:Peroxidase n=3 Tax=Aegilops tauschii TaxID=37682 RepID=A0A453MXH0_AEGTS|nr:peroxidase 2 [Aegilops tauschii subsp. strangulata]
MAASYITTWRCALLALLALFVSGAYGQLSPTFYALTCPNLEAIVRSVMNTTVTNENRMGASLLRLHFHDCFVEGCDGSVLLDNVPATATTPAIGEKNAFGNINSLRGFEVIDTIKAAVEQACPGVVSCADILTLAARDGTFLLGGPTWTVPLGRRDSTTASMDLANRDLPPPFANLVTNPPDGSDLIARFQRKGLSATEMTVLSGAHTIGSAQCQNYRLRLYNENRIDFQFAQGLKANCPQNGPAGDTFLAPLDSTGSVFDNKYYADLTGLRGLLHSDQVLYPQNNQTQAKIVLKYKGDNAAFFADFAAAMIKMGNLSPLTGSAGQIRTNCRLVNP